MKRHKFIFGMVSFVLVSLLANSAWCQMGQKQELVEDVTKTIKAKIEPVDQPRPMKRGTSEQEISAAAAREAEEALERGQRLEEGREMVALKDIQVLAGSIVVSIDAKIENPTTALLGLSVEIYRLSEGEEFYTGSQQFNLTEVDGFWVPEGSATLLLDGDYDHKLKFDYCMRHEDFPCDLGFEPRQPKVTEPAMEYIWRYGDVDGAPSERCDFTSIETDKRGNVVLISKERPFIVCLMLEGDKVESLLDKLKVKFKGVFEVIQ